jgi:hypothetical protein
MAKALLHKIEALPDERISEIEDFAEFIAALGQERSVMRAVWSNPEDDVYDAL